MNILWKGKTYLQVTTKTFLKDKVVVSVDPFLDNKGNFLAKADITLLSSPTRAKDGSLLKSGPIAEDKFLIDEPGEYEIKEVYIKGIPSKGKERDNVIYTLESEDIKICHLGLIQQKELSSDQLEKIGEVDILALPIGDGEFINKNRKSVSSLISQIEPKIIIPIGYSITSDSDIFNKKPIGLDNFLKTVGQDGAIVRDKLSIKRKELLGDGSKVIILRPKKS